MILHRFCSRAEFDKFMAGELLINRTDHRKQGRATHSKGFCFFQGDVDEWAHRLNGLVDFDVLITIDLPKCDIKRTKAIYSAKPGISSPATFTEFCTQAYSAEASRLIDVDTSYAHNGWFVSRGDAQRLLERLSELAKHGWLACSDW